MNVETSAEPTLEEAVLTPGEYLRQAREKYGLSVEDVATELNLTVAQISSLEDNRFGDLPGKTYILGYMKAYARLVNCTEAELFRNFDLQEDNSIRGIKPVMKETRSRGRYKKMLSLPLIAVVGGLMFLWWQSRERSEVISLEAGSGQQQDMQPADQGPAGTPAQAEMQIIAPVLTGGESAADGNSAEAGTTVGEVRTATGAGSDTQTIEDQLQAQIAAEVQSQARDQNQVLPPGPEGEDPARDGDAATEPMPAAQVAAVESVAESPTQTVKKKKPAANAGKGRTVNMEFSATSWVDLRDAEGQRLLYENVNQGRQVSVKGKPPFSVFLGNAGGVEIEYEGKPFDFSAFTNGVYARFELGTQHKNQPDR